jgi:hypothetical protein
LKDPSRDVHYVPYYSISFAGVPAGDIASIFGNDKIATGADVQFSFGQAYLASYATPFDVQAARANLARLVSIADSIERLHQALDAEAAKSQPQDSLVRTLRAALDAQRVLATRYRESLETRKSKERRRSVRDALDVAKRFADVVVAYAAPDAREKPPVPDPSVAIAQKGGPIYDAWFVRGGLNAGSATFFNSSTAFGEQFDDQDYNGYSAQAGYSFLLVGNLPLIVAVSSGLTRRVNVDELSSVEVTETQSFVSADGVTRRTTSRKRTGLVGDLEQETNAVAKWDLVLYPGLGAASEDGKSLKSIIALDLFGRSKSGSRTV